MDIEVTRCDDECIRVRLANHSFCLTPEEAERLLVGLMAQAHINSLREPHEDRTVRTTHIMSQDED